MCDNVYLPSTMQRYDILFIMNDEVLVTLSYPLQMSYRVIVFLFLYSKTSSMYSCVWFYTYWYYHCVCLVLGAVQFWLCSISVTRPPDRETMVHRLMFNILIYLRPAMYMYERRQNSTQRYLFKHAQFCRQRGQSICCARGS